MNQIEKIDLLRERLDISYNEADQMLRKVNGDVVQALINLEQQTDSTFSGKNAESEKNEANKWKLLKKIKQLISRGHTARIKVRKEADTLVEIPVTAGLVGLYMFPYLSILAGVSAMYSDYILEIDREKTSQNNTQSVQFRPKEQSRKKEAGKEKF